MNDSHSMTSDQLVQQIKDAFANTKYPGDNKIVPDYKAEYDPSYKNTKALYMGKRWQSLDLDFLNCSQFDLCYLSTEGFRYYLPGLMVGTVRYGQEILYVAECFILALSPKDYGNEEMNREQLESLDGFDRPQRDAIRAYLSYAKIHIIEEGLYQEDVDAAIRFWKTLD